VFGGGGWSLAHFFGQFVDHPGLTVGECFDDQPPGWITQYQDDGSKGEWWRSGFPWLGAGRGLHVAARPLAAGSAVCRGNIADYSKRLAAYMERLGEHRERLAEHTGCLAAYVDCRSAEGLCRRSAKFVPTLRKSVPMLRKRVPTLRRRILARGGQLQRLGDLELLLRGRWQALKTI
jgi:hypothetical protein